MLDNHMLAELDPQKVCAVIVKLREFGVQAEPNQGGGSDPADDRFVEVFENQPNPSAKQETEGFIAGMNTDEQRELVALCLVGRGDYAKEVWGEALRTAGSRPEPTTAAFLLGIPLASDYLEEGLDLFGFSCADTSQENL